MPKINPFKPQSPVNPGMFIGRLPEILRIENLLFQTKSGQPSNFIITGERGIGKSSLLLYIKVIAQGHITTTENIKLNFLVIDTDIDQTTTQLGLIKKIELGLNMALGETEPARKFLKESWGFLQRVEVSGVKINPKSDQVIDEIIFEKFSYAFAETVERITSLKESSIFNSTYDGVLILIDEADRSSKAIQLGSFLKLFTERLQRRGCTKTMIGLAGLLDLRNVLRESHESSLRIFDELVLDRLSDDEVDQVIDTCLEKANKDNSTSMQITEDGRKYLISLSEGYPHFIQQFGYSAFETDTDNLIDENDVARGGLGENGALELIGERYYRDNFYNKIQKESYRQVLRIMADNLDGWVSKQEIRRKYKGKESVLDNAIQALRDRHIIIPKEGERGIYRLQHKGFALWIKIKTMDPTKIQSAIDNHSVKTG